MRGFIQLALDVDAEQQQDDDDSNNNSVQMKEIRKQFELKNFTLEYFNENYLNDERTLRAFYVPFWPLINRFVYLVYRIGIAVYYTIWLIESIFRNVEFRSKKIFIQNKNGTALFLLHPWPFYMTSWSLTALAVHLWLMALLVVYFYNFNNTFLCFGAGGGASSGNGSDTSSTDKQLKCEVEIPLNMENTADPSTRVTFTEQQQQEQSQEQPTPGFIKVIIKISFLLYNIVAISAIIVTTSYFSYVWFAQLKPDPDILMQIGDFHRHGLNSFVVLIDMVITAYPVFILHFIYTLAYGYTYALATYVYWRMDPVEHIIYFTLDYSKPLTISIFYLFLSFVTFILQVVHYFVFKLKLYIMERVCENCERRGVMEK